MAPPPSSFESQLVEAKAKHPPNLEHGCNSLHVASLKGDLDSVNILLWSGEFDVSDKCEHGGTALTYAAWNTNSSDIVHSLLQAPRGMEILNAQGKFFSQIP